MTEQSIFNRVWQHFVVEKKSAGISEDGLCAYHGKNGSPCALGMFIPQDDILSINSLPIAEVIRRCSAVKMIFKDIDIRFLGELQNAHDASVAHKAKFHERIEKELVVVADINNLTIPTMERELVHA